MRDLIEAKIEERGWPCVVSEHQGGKAYTLTWAPTGTASDPRFAGKSLTIAQALVEDADEFLSNVASECEKENFDPVSGTFYAEAAE